MKYAIIGSGHIATALAHTFTKITSKSPSRTLVDPGTACSFASLPEEKEGN